MQTRRPKPKALKLLEGGKIRKARGVPSPKLVNPPPPATLTADGKKEWKRVAPKLYELGLLSELDLSALLLYCSAFARVKLAEEQLAKGGYVIVTQSGYKQQSPWVGIMNRATKALNDAALEFGMSPASRSRVTAKPPEPEDEFKDFDSA